VTQKPTIFKHLLYWMRAVLGFSCLALPLAAQQDTLFALPPIDVTDWRTNTNLFGTRIHSDSLGNYQGTGLGIADVLQRMEGVFIRDYGGHGGIKSVSLRGFAANQTNISIENIPVQQSLSGITNLAQFPLHGMQAIEVQPSHASLAQNSQAGQLNLSLRPSIRLLKLKSGIGSFGERTAQMSVQLPVRKHIQSIHYQYLGSSDDYPFEWNEMQGRRQNNHLRQHQLQTTLRFGSRERPIEYIGLASLANQTIPVPVIKGNIDGKPANLWQLNAFHALKQNRAAAFPRWLDAQNEWKAQFEWIAKHQMEHMDYDDNTGYDRYRLHNGLIQARYSAGKSKHRIETLVQGIYTHLSSNNIGIGLNPVRMADRPEFNAGCSYLLGFREINDWWTHITLRPLVRVNYSPQFGALYNWSLEGNSVIDPSGKWVARFQIGQGYRLPSFNELYFFAFGNPDLNPERAQTLDVGIKTVQQWRAWQLTVKLATFYNQTWDKIISVPINPARWSTYALGFTQSYGGESAVQLQWNNRWKAGINYTYCLAQEFAQTSGAQLPYTPQHLLQSNMACTFSRWEIGCQYLYSAFRYTNLQNDVWNFMPSYQLLDAFTNYHLPIRRSHWVIGLQMMNILDESYAIIQSYPMPRRAWRVQLQLIFK
jgi:vitamin B12 transporter